MSEHPCKHARVHDGVIFCMVKPFTPSLNFCLTRCGSYSGPARGLGDVVKKAIDATGIGKFLENCGGCEQRRLAWNKLVSFQKKEADGVADHQ